MKRDRPIWDDGHCGTYFLDSKNALSGGSGGSSTELTRRRLPVESLPVSRGKQGADLNLAVTIALRGPTDDAIIPAQALSTKRRRVKSSARGFDRLVHLTRARAGLPTRTSKWRSPSSRLRMKVESKLIVIAGVAADGFSAAASVSRSPTCRVWLRNVSGLVPASIDNGCCITSTATRYGISADSQSLQLVQLRGRPTVRWPTATGFTTTAAGTHKPRKPHPDLADQSYPESS